MQILLLTTACLIAAGTIAYGKSAQKRNKAGSIKKAVFISASSFGLVAASMMLTLLLGNPAYAETGAAAAVAVPELSMGDGMKFLAAALSTGLATIGAGLAVASVGSSAIGAISEDSSLLGKTLIYVGMAEGIAIYGMIISILILFA
ncbi:MAG: ATP synthase subunit C [Eubacteriales bacterium]|jgi:V/A-type H+-transporting ATPase subunit K|nr:ATP synthase subunit C [Eubacteriales bacterium]MDD3290182.1 ATP synthase subunit C [Eubacteriales bacterium]MDD3864395.1 ATP synthase subunit C [Eubacteriales bacterium]MDD4444835.1 ATP synthase subunit C [Eubacteriales bacterium]